MAKHFRKVLLVEAVGPGTPQLSIDEFDSFEAARGEMRKRYEHYSGDCFEGSSIEYDHAIIYSDHYPAEWMVYEI